MAPEISVVVPLFNEAENVSPLVRQILQAFDSGERSVEVLLVDDCSTDSTWGRIAEEASRDPRVRGLRHPANRGQSAALWTGFQNSRGEIIATLDGDQQNDPADLPRMLALLSACDMVCGARTNRMDTFVRRVSSRIARWARRAALRSQFTDTGCNLRVFKREVLQALMPFNGIHRFMPILAQAGGAIVKEVPVSHRPRVAGVSKYGIWNRLGRGVCDLVMVGLYTRRQLKLLRQPSVSSTKPSAGSARPPELEATASEPGAPRAPGRPDSRRPGDGV